MNMKICVGLCDGCYLQGFCQAQVRKIVSMDELENEAFRLDACNSVVEHVRGIPNLQCAFYFADWYGAFGGWFEDGSGKDVFVNLDALLDTNDYWFRDNFRKPHTKAICLRTENREALRALFSLLRAIEPAKAALWGLRPANDNFRA